MANSQFARNFSIIPYASVTTDMVNNSLYTTKDDMLRSVRGNDDVIVIYPSANRSTYSAYQEYEMSNLSNFLNSTEFSINKPFQTIDFVEVKGDIRDATPSEIYDIEITTAGTGYSAGTLTATGGGGISFKGTYAVDGSGAITAVRILTMGTGYTSTPTIVIEDSGDGNAVLTPVLRGESLEVNTRVLDVSLKDDLTYASTLTIDKNTSGNDAEHAKGLQIDFDRTVASSGTATHTDVGIDLDINSASLGTSSVRGMDIDVVGATSGTHTAIGIDLDVDSADTNIGMQINTAGTHLKLVANADTDDYATFSLADTGDLTISTVGDGTTDSDLIFDVDGSIELNADNMATGITFKDASATVGSISAHHNASWFVLNENGGASTVDYFAIECLNHGATVLKTIDNAAAAAHLTLDADGDITLDSSSGNFITMKDGTEFSVANSAYAGMIVGYTCIRNATGASYHNYITVGTSFATLQTYQGTDVSIVFKAPPSGNVEIAFSACVSASSREVNFALSDNSTYNELNAIHTYDDFNWKSDETDHDTITVRFVVTGLTAGTSYTYYIGAKASSASAYIYHGADRSDDKHSPPIIVKAVALPGTITTGE